MISRSSCYLGVLAAAIVVAACERPAFDSSSATARSSQSTSINLAGGRLPALPSGPVFIRVVEFAQGAGGSFTSQKHVPGLIYVVDGVHHLVIIDGPSVDLRAGDAYFLGSLSHLHINPEAARNHWYFLALWPTAARSAPLVDPTATVVFETPDLPALSLPPGSYVNTLQLMTVGPGGRSAAHRHGGIEVLFVLDGTVSARADGASPTSLNTGGGIYHLPNTVVQEFNVGDVEAHYLAFFVTADDEPFETNVKQSP